MSTYVKLALSTVLCLLVLSANAQNERYIRINEEKTLDFGDPVGQVHFYNGEIFLEMGDDPKGKHVQYKDSTVLLTYSQAGNQKATVINYSKLYETDTALNAKINRQAGKLRDAIAQSMSISGEGDTGNLQVDLKTLDRQFDERVKVQLANNISVRLISDTIRQGQVSLGRLDFPVRVIPQGYPTFWLNKDRINTTAAKPVAESKKKPATARTEDNQPEQVEEASSGSSDGGWLLWVIALLALAAAVLSLLNFLRGQNTNSGSASNDLAGNQKEILRRLTDMESPATAVAVGKSDDNEARKKELAALKEEKSRLAAELEKMKKSQADQDSRLAAATTKLSSAGQKALIFNEDTRSFADHRMEVISQALALYDSLVYLFNSNGVATSATVRSLLAGIVLTDRLFQLANKARVYGVELDRLATSGVWTDPAHVRKLKDEPNEANRLEYIDKDRYKNVLAPFLSRLSVMLETVRNLSRFSGQDSSLTEQAGEIGSKAHELRKSARQLLGIEMDYVPLFSPVADHPHVNAVPGEPDDRVNNIQVEKNHILQIKEYGMTYGDSKSGTEVILKR